MSLTSLTSLALPICLMLPLSSSSARSPSLMCVMVLGSGGGVQQGSDSRARSDFMVCVPAAQSLVETLQQQLETERVHGGYEKTRLR